jgi:phosphomannomutase
MGIPLDRFKPLRFGTSGLRDKVEHMTDMECYVNTRGFLKFLNRMGEFTAGTAVAVGGDRRRSTDRIKRAVFAAVRDMKGEVDDQGLTSTPALTYYAMQKGIPGIMVTGSHIPEDRNGIKFTKTVGEVLKSDEEGILACVAEEREKVYAMVARECLFNQDTGMFKSKEAESASSFFRKKDTPGPCMRAYADRYKKLFDKKQALSGAKLFFYEHSAAARDVAKEIFEALGVKVFAPDEDIKIEYSTQSGERKEETIALRSPVFVAVDTESVSSRTLSVFKTVMNEKDLDTGCTMDGDSDRPLLVYRVYREGKPTQDIGYMTGDILGLLAVLALNELGVEISAVAVPISANDAIIKTLYEKDVEITQTKIGSPYVVAAMLESLKKHPKSKYPVWNVFSWESNGGFLTGNDIKMGGHILKALPTRDAILPILTVLWMAENRGVPLSMLVDQLPSRYTHADRIKQFPTEKGRAIIGTMSPAGESGVMQVAFASDGKAVAGYLDGSQRIFGPESKFHKIKKHLETFFTVEDGFSDIVGLNYIDGVRIFFSNGDISHFRPSGNAPEFRNYAIANSPERSRAIVETGLNKIIPQLAARIVQSAEGGA